MHYQYLFVVNPIAGGTDKSEFYEIVKDYAHAHDFTYQIYKTTGKDDEKAISKLLAEDEPETVVAVGGDGTIQQLLSLVKYTPLQLGIVPMGSANGMAAELNIPTDEEDALEIILEAHTRKLDLIRVDGTHDCLHIGDVGFNARLIKHFEEENQRGLTGYAIQFFREFQDPKPYQVTLTLDGETRTLTSYMVAFANARKYGTGASINPKGKIDDGQFEICIIKDISIRTFWDWLITINEFNPELIEVIPCKTAIIESEQPIWLQTDGEVLGKVQRVDLAIQPACVEVLTPHP